MTMNDSQTYHLIDRYLNGELEGEELAAFEQRLADEPAFKQEVAFQRELAAVVADGETMDFSAMVAEVVEGTESSSSSRAGSGGMNWRWMAIAASVLLVAVVGFFVLRGGESDPKALFADNFAPYEAPVEFRGGDSTLAERFEFAFSSYQLEAYGPAADAFQDILNTDPDEFSARFYLGVCKLAQDNGAGAEKEFRNLLAQNAPTWRSQAQWYLAMALLQQGKADAAEQELEALETRGGKYGKLAGELLGEL